MTATSQGWISSLRWWVGEFSGASAYDKYVARHRREHPGHPPLDARAFWRRRAAEAEASVGTRCC